MVSIAKMKENGNDFLKEGELLFIISGLPELLLFALGLLGVCKQTIGYEY